MARKTLGLRLGAVLGTLAVLATSVIANPGAANAQAAPAAAAPAAALSVSPPTAALDAAPGAVLTQKIGLDNISDDPRDVSVIIQNFSAQGEQGQAQLSTGEGRYALSQWITSSPTSAHLEAHGHQDFTITIKVPQNAPPGGHFGAVVFSPNAGSTNGGAALSVVSQVTSLILLRVPGDVTEKITSAGVNVCKPKKTVTTCDKLASFFQQGPLTLTARLKNEGNVQVEPTGTVTIKNMFGKKVKTIKLDQHNVLPDSIRRSDSKFTSKNLFGRYTAKYDITYGSTGQKLTATTSFTVIPLVKIGIGILVLALLFLIFWLPRKRLKKAFKALAASGD